MPLPSFTSPPFVLGNYSIFGDDLQINPTNGISCNSSIYTNAQGHSAVSQTFQIYSADLLNNVTRTGFFADSETGQSTSYYEFMYDPADNVTNPVDFIRVEVVWEKQLVGPIGPGNPLLKTIRVISQQLGLIYTHPTYEIDPFITPNAAVFITVGNDNGNGSADVTVSWNDSVYSQSFVHLISSYPFNIANAFSWRYHTKLNVEARSNFTHIEDFIQLIVIETIAVPSIESEEAFGIPIIAVVAPLIIDPPSINSEETLGIPVVSLNLKFILPLGIPSEETFPIPDVKVSTIIQSQIGADELPKEGDIRLMLLPYVGYLEMVLADRDVEREPSLETEALIVLSTDREADVNDALPDDNGYKGGWWADAIPLTPTIKIGTRLWLLKRAKVDNELASRAKEYVEEGFAYWLTDGIAQEVQVTTELVQNATTQLLINIKVVRTDIKNEFFKFFYNWENQEIRRAINAI